MLAGCTSDDGSAGPDGGSTEGRTTASGDVLPASQVDPLVAALPQESVA